mmetsp:Transcript_182482/g.578310  ORF Transcript_182482/g.578310 Transcript_182482/m.578310 type:complete len:233 (+) Transcript_182482:399-1097(+)
MWNQRKNGVEQIAVPLLVIIRVIVSAGQELNNRAMHLSERPQAFQIWADSGGAKPTRMPHSSSARSPCELAPKGRYNLSASGQLLCQPWPWLHTKYGFAGGRAGKPRKRPAVFSANTLTKENVAEGSATASGLWLCAPLMFALLNFRTSCGRCAISAAAFAQVLSLGHGPWVAPHARRTAASKRSAWGSPPPRSSFRSSSWPRCTSPSSTSGGASTSSSAAGRARCPSDARG